MTQKPIRPGIDELRAARKESRGLYWMVGIFSFFCNLLMLTGPLYMLQVYDRVLGSRSEETLLALSLLVVFLFATMGILEYCRGRVMARAGARFQARLDRRVFDAMVRRSAVMPDPKAQTGLADLESVQRMIGAPVLMAVFDIPWTPVFLAGIMIFHPWLGYLALGGGAVLVLISFLNQAFSRGPQQDAQIAGQKSQLMSEEIRNEAEIVTAMGMRDAAFRRWQESRTEALSGSVGAADISGTFTSMTKTLRQFLQSAMLGLGAYLVLRGELSPGAMIAGSILMGRALAPIEIAIGQWSIVQRGQKGWQNLAELLGSTPPEITRTTLPKPKANVAVRALTVLPPGEKRATLKNLSFDVAPGEAIGVIGSSGAGKSTLARALTGVWLPAGGTVRLDGAGIDQYGSEDLGRHIGYLPQRVQLFEGTIAQNIARLSDNPDPAKIVAAAKKSAAHEMIVRLPDGYDTRVRPGGGRLSGGQIQRIGLARALYDDPVILILDEPNSNLDNEGSQALNHAIRTLKEEGRSALIMAHRPAAIQECDKLLVLDHGMRAAFGPKDEVLRSMVSNHADITRTAAMGGVQ